MRCHSGASKHRRGRTNSWRLPRYSREAAVPLQPCRWACDMCRKYDISITTIVAVDVVSNSM